MRKQLQDDISKLRADLQTARKENAQLRIAQAHAAALPRASATPSARKSAYQPPAASESGAIVKKKAAIAVLASSQTADSMEPTDMLAARRIQVSRG